jgi:ribosomal protein L40E
MNYKKAKKQLLSGKSLALCDNDTIKYTREPIGKGIINTKDRSRGKEEKPHWTDRIKCKICGKVYARSAVGAHNKTQYHQLYKKFDEKIRKLMLEDDEKRNDE